jgi:hypothetical protein
LEKKWEREKRENERGASAPIAAATAVGRPRACIVRTLREKNGIALALIAEKRSRVSDAGWDGGQARVGC